MTLLHLLRTAATILRGAVSNVCILLVSNLGACSPSLWVWVWQGMLRVWQGMLMHEMHKSGAITRVLQLLGTAGHSILLCSAAAGEVLCRFVGEESVYSPSLGTSGFPWVWGAPHPRVQGEVSGSGALFFSCGCTVVWRVPALQSLLPASSWWKVLNNPGLGFGFFFSFFWLSLSAWKIYAALKKTFHSSASYYSCRVSNKVWKGGRERGEERWELVFHMESITPEVALFPTRGQWRGCICCLMESRCQWKETSLISD